MRFTEETLDICHNGKHIADLLAPTVAEAVEFFCWCRQYSAPLQILMMPSRYLDFWVSRATCFSGGEAQRIKLAYELSRSSQSGTLYLLDEPLLTGPKLADIEKLLHVLQALVDQGNTVVVVEHNSWR